MDIYFFSLKKIELIFSPQHIYIIPNERTWNLELDES